MKYPKAGMHYEEVKKRLTRIKTVDKEGKIKNRPLADNITNSLINQARLAEGDDAVNELVKDTNNHSSNKVGASSKYADNYDRIFN